MFLEDSAVGREVWREMYPSLLHKVAELLSVVLQQKGLTDGLLCYVAVKVDSEHLLRDWLMLAPRNCQRIPWI